MLEDKRIKELIDDDVLINVDTQCIQPISVDLKIESVVHWEIDEEITNKPIVREGRKIQEGKLAVTHVGICLAGTRRKAHSVL